MSSQNRWTHEKSDSSLQREHTLLANTKSPPLGPPLTAPPTDFDEPNKDIIGLVLF